MSHQRDHLIEEQRDQVFNQSGKVVLKSACGIDNGILRLSEEEKKNALSTFEKISEQIGFFIPASGSGSRMFAFLHDFSKNGVKSELYERFIQKLNEFAWFAKLPDEMRAEIKKLNEKELVDYILFDQRLDFGSLPKGLIPFHTSKGQVFNPFQEHVMQASQLFSGNTSVHFTIQSSFLKEVQSSINELEGFSGVQVSFSDQDENTNAYCFDEERGVVYNGQGALRRPAGHGALLQNLNAVDTDIVLIKNIDNVQHIDRSVHSNDMWKVLLGLMEEFRNEFRKLRDNWSEEGVRNLNKRMQFLSEQELSELTREKFDELVNRPIRVCGMVKNEGAPGGGPFWIDDNGHISKQIIEKVQISGEEDQQKVLSESSHFNPVLIAACKVDLDGNRIDLMQHADKNKFLSVSKTHHGERIFYRELPGLWNGGMHDWNTIFVEVPSHVFSPVKNMVDLLADEHQPLV